MEVREIIQIINQLKAEKDPKNNELIAFYEKIVKETYAEAYAEALRKVWQ